MRIRFSLFLLLAVLASCAKQPIVPPPQEDVLYQIEDCFAQTPDSVMQILDTLDVTVLSEKERAHYCLLKVWTRDYRYLYDSITDSLLQVAENYFVGGKDKWFEAETCEALSRIAFKEGKGEQIKFCLLEIENIMRHTEPECDCARILDIIERAACALAGDCRILIVIEPHRAAETVVACLNSQVRSDAGIHAAAHCDQCL